MIRNTQEEEVGELSQGIFDALVERIERMGQGGLQRFVLTKALIFEAFAPHLKVLVDRGNRAAASVEEVLKQMQQENDGTSPKKRESKRLDKVAALEKKASGLGTTTAEENKDEEPAEDN